MLATRHWVVWVQTIPCIAKLLPYGRAFDVLKEVGGYCGGVGSWVHEPSGPQVYPPRFRTPNDREMGVFTGLFVSNLNLPACRTKGNRKSKVEGQLPLFQLLWSARASLEH